MNKELLASISEELQKQRRMLLQQVLSNEADFEKMSDAREPELEEHAQGERIATLLRHLDEREQERLGEIDAALARIEAGTYGRCENCGRAIDDDRLRALPTTVFCGDCSAKLKSREPREGEELPESGRLPPDLEILDDKEVNDRLMEMVREDGQVDTEELRIITRNGVLHLKGAVPSEEEHQVLLRILTDVAGVHEIVDRLEIRRIAWERDDRSKTDESATEVQPGTIPKKEPYGGTEDPVLANEEGVDYEPPANPPPPPHRKE